MASKNNKYYSNKQESMVADYLGWHQVGGSGSKAYAPGDVNSDNWLGECKTHDTEQAKIMFFKTHWFKICEEARAKGRYPALFVDNGTQVSQNTWVMVPLRVFDPAQINIIDGLKNTSTKKNSLTFEMLEAKDLYRKGQKDDKFNMFKITWERDLGVMPLSTFKDFVAEYF
jgi:hypothetical protein